MADAVVIYSSFHKRRKRMTDTRVRSMKFVGILQQCIHPARFMDIVHVSTDWRATSHHTLIKYSGELKLEQQV